MSIKITYFAHGADADEDKEVSSGWSDVDLSELGVKQSKELRDEVKDKKFDVIFSSDLKRALNTAKLVFEGMVPIVIDSRLRECSYGKLNGGPKSVIELMCEGECVYNKFPEGESYEDVKNRMSDFLNFLKNNYEGKSVAIVAHKAPQLALDVLLKGKTWEQALAEDWRKTKTWQPGWEYQLN